MAQEPLRHTFRKDERLCSKKMIENLFQSGSSIMAFPLRLQFLLIDSTENSPVKILFSVPKKRFKRAVKRNLLRRRMKEAFRLNKHLFVELIPKDKQLVAAFIFVDNQIHSYDSILKGTIKALERYRLKQKSNHKTAEDAQ